MKRIFLLSITFILIIALVPLVCIAEEVQTVTDPGESVGVSNAPELSAEDSEKMTSESIREAVDKTVNAITSSSYWVTLVGFVTMLIGVVVLVRNKFKLLFSAISKLATHDKSTADGKKNTAEIKDLVSEKTGELFDAVKTMSEDYKLLMTVFTVFIENTKMNPNAKAEVLQLITRVRTISETVPVAVVESIDRINAANRAEEVQPTPALDAAIAIKKDSPTMLLE